MLRIIGVFRTWGKDAMVNSTVCLAQPGQAPPGPPMNSVIRPSGRASDQLRAVSIERHYTRHAEGSVLVGFGDTRVLCTASIEDRAPAWLRGKGEGWITAEYGMLPRATNTRTDRKSTRLNSSHHSISYAVFC